MSYCYGMFTLMRLSGVKRLPRSSPLLVYIETLKMIYLCVYKGITPLDSSIYLRVTNPLYQIPIIQSQWDRLLLTSIILD